MITGLLIVDGEGKLYFDLPPSCSTKELGHYHFFEGISEDCVVLYGRTAWKQSILNHPPHHSAIPIVNKTVKQVQSSHPHWPILIVGNHKVLRNMKYLDRLIVINYQAVGIPINDRLKMQWEEPCHPKKTLAISPLYTITQYNMDEECDVS